MKFVPIRAAEGRWSLFTAVLILVSLVTAVVSSLGAPLVPLISADLNVTVSAAQWSLTAALLTGAVGAPIIGRLGDGPHRRGVLIGGLAIVMLGGVAAALADSLGVLLLGRGMQGLGLGLAPLVMASARDALPTSKVLPTISLLSVVTTAGLGAGYPISGLIAEHMGLQAAYWFGAGFAACALIAVVLVVPPSTRRKAVPLDVPGALLLALALIALLVALGQAPVWGWGSASIIALFATGTALIAIWVPQQLGASHPLVELRLMRHGAVLTANATATVLGVAMYLMTSGVTAFVQVPSVLGYGFSSSVLIAGCCLLPFSVMSFVASQCVPTLRRFLGANGVLPVGCLIVAASAAIFTFVHEALWQVFAIMGLLGVGMGMTFAALPALIVSAVPNQETGSALGFHQVVRGIGFSVGSTLTATLLAAHTVGGSRHSSEGGFVMIGVIAIGLCFAAALVAWSLPVWTVVRAARATRPIGVR